MGDEIRVGVVGASGGIAETHIEAIGRDPELRLAGMCDVVPEPQGERAAKAKCPTFSDWREFPTLSTATTYHS